MKLLLTVLIFSSASLAVNIVCYYESASYGWKSNSSVSPENLNATLCTHINYAFVGLAEDGSLQTRIFDPDLYKRTVNLKNKNPDLKVLLSIAAPSERFSKIAANATTRAKLVKTARSFMEQYKFDGIDFDWETPEQQDNMNFIKLLEECREDFDKNSWLITAAIPVIPSNGYNVPKLSQILDYFNLMTYNMYGAGFSSYTGQNSPLYSSSIESLWEKEHLNMNASVNLWISAGANRSKINGGVPFYGRSYTLPNAARNQGIHSPFLGPGEPGPVVKAPGVLTLLELCMNQNSWDCHVWDDEQKMPICTYANQWLAIENKRSIIEKMSFIKSQKLSGAMIWAIDQDDVHGSCTQQKQTYLNTIYDNLQMSP